jgi:LPXTG-motif cell wall-anchored protein
MKKLYKILRSENNMKNSVRARKDSRHLFIAGTTVFTFGLSLFSLSSIAKADAIVKANTTNVASKADTNELTTKTDKINVTSKSNIIEPTIKTDRNNASKATSADANDENDTTKRSVINTGVKKYSLAAASTKLSTTEPTTESVGCDDSGNPQFSDYKNEDITTTRTFKETKPGNLESWQTLLQAYSCSTYKKSCVGDTAYQYFKNDTQKLNMIYKPEAAKRSKLLLVSNGKLIWHINGETGSVDLNDQQLYAADFYSDDGSMGTAIVCDLQNLHLPFPKNKNQWRAGDSYTLSFKKIKTDQAPTISGSFTRIVGMPVTGSAHRVKVQYKDLSTGKALKDPDYVYTRDGSQMMEDHDPWEVTAANTIGNYSYVKTTFKDQESTEPKVSGMITYNDQDITYWYDTEHVQKAIINYVDDTTGKIVATDSVTGDSGSAINYSTSTRIEGFEKLGDELVSDGYPKGAKFDNNDAVDQIFIVHLKHTTKTVTPEDPGNPGQPINPDNPNIKYPDGTDKNSLLKVVKRTINYLDKKTGKTVASQVVQTVTYRRVAIVDDVTGKLLGYDTNGDGVVDINDGNKAWMLSGSNVLAAVTSPDLSSKGYGPADQAIVVAKEISSDYTGGDIVVNVYYTATSGEPDTPDIPNHNTPDDPNHNVPDDPTPNTPDNPDHNVPDDPTPNIPDNPNSNTPDSPNHNTPNNSNHIKPNVPNHGIPSQLTPNIPAHPIVNAPINIKLSSIKTTVTFSRKAKSEQAELPKTGKSHSSKNDIWIGILLLLTSTFSLFGFKFYKKEDK